MLMMNKGRTARMRYGPNGVQQLSSGDHVICAKSGEAIPLDELRYWSVERQEAYANPQIATQAFLDAMK